MMKKTGIVLMFVATQLVFGQKHEQPQAFLPDVLTEFPSVRDFTISAAEAARAVRLPVFIRYGN